MASLLHVRQAQTRTNQSFQNYRVPHPAYRAIRVRGLPGLTLAQLLDNVGIFIASHSAPFAAPRTTVDVLGLRWGKSRQAVSTLDQNFTIIVGKSLRLIGLLYCIERRNEYLTNAGRQFSGDCEVLIFLRT